MAWVAGAPAQDRPVECNPPTSDCLLEQARMAAEGLGRQLQKDEAHFAIAAALARLGRLDEANEEKLQISNPITQAEVEGEIVRAAARAGEFDSALEIALGIGDVRNRSAMVLALEALAVEQAAQGEIDDAFDTVIAINNPFRRTQAQAAIAVSVAETGDIPKAIRTAARIGMDYWFAAGENPNKIASGLVARTGEFDHYWFYDALAQIAELQAKGGDILSAMQTAHAIPDQVGRGHALSRIAAVQAQQGQIDAALESARRIDAAYGDQMAMIAISDGMAAVGDHDAALELALSIRKTYGDGAALTALAVRYARAEEFEQGLQTLAMIDVLADLNQARAAVAMEFARAGQLMEALDLAAEIPDRNERFEAVEAMVVMLAAAGDPTSAMELAEAFAASSDLDELTMAIALALGQQGDISGALDTIGGVEDEMFRAIALAGLAESAG